jgi:hypothetical protein
MSDEVTKAELLRRIEQLEELVSGSRDVVRTNKIEVVDRKRRVRVVVGDEDFRNVEPDDDQGYGICLLSIDGELRANWSSRMVEVNEHLTS